MLLRLQEGGEREQRKGIWRCPCRMVKIIWISVWSAHGYTPFGTGSLADHFHAFLRLH